MKKQYSTVTKSEAIAAGYDFITDHYSPEEFPLLDKALEDLQGARILLVASGYHIQVWRHKHELKKQ